MVLTDSSPRRVTVAAVQATPVFLDREATTDKACALIKEAAAAGASLVVFPETFIPTYPDWVWRRPAWSDAAFVERLYANSVAIPSPTLDQLLSAASDAGAYVAMGVNEIDGGTLYNTLLYLGPDGSLLGRHRKLMPTGGERTVWGMGDGSTLGVVADAVRGARRADLLGELHAARPRGHVRPGRRDLRRAHLGQLRHLGGDAAAHRQGGSLLRHRLLAAAPRQRRSSRAARRRLRRRRRLDEPGPRAPSSRPAGEILAGPLSEHEGILYAEIDTATIGPQRREFDPVGHYARPDVLRLTVDTTRRDSVSFHRAAD